MTDYPYEPPERMYADTMLTFRDFELASTWSVRIENDPLGPVNKVVTLMRGGRRVKSVLCPVPKGATVRLVRDEGGYSLQELFALKELVWRTDRTGDGRRVATGHVPYRMPGWRVEIDDRTVLTVADEHTPYVAPPVPLWRRFRSWTTKRARSAADGLARRLGYVRESEAGGDW